MSASNEITADTNGGETTSSAGGGASPSCGGWGVVVARGVTGNRGGAVSTGSGGWGARESTDSVNCVRYRMRCGPLFGLFQAGDFCLVIRTDERDVGDFGERRCGRVWAPVVGLLPFHACVPLFYLEDARECRYRPDEVRRGVDESEVYWSMDWAVGVAQVASQMVVPNVSYDYRVVLADCGVDVDDDIYAPVSVAGVHLQGWRSLVHGGDVAVDVLRVFHQLGRVSVGAQLIAERGLLGEVVLAFGGRAERGSRLGYLVFRGTDALLAGIPNVEFPTNDPNFLAGLELYSDCVRALCAAYALEDIIDYLEGMAGFGLGDRFEY